MDRMDKLSILLVDDMEEIAEICEDILGNEFGHRIECLRNPAAAPRLIKDRLFDIVIIDAKMTYKRAVKGGLLLAEEAAGILGMDSVIIMSQYDVRDEVLELSPEFTFLPKPRGDESFRDWIQTKLLVQIRQLFRRQYGFVVMPFRNMVINELYENNLIPWMKEAGFSIKRMDEMPGQGAINTALLDKIRHAHFVIVYFSEKNDNVYFEAGFAAALDKFSIFYASNIKLVAFNLSLHQIHILGGSDKEKERLQLLQHMRRLRGVA